MNIADLWLGLLDSTAAQRALSALGYRETGSVIDELKTLHNSRIYHAHSNIGRERLDRLMPMCIRAAVQSPDPDTTLSRLIRFIEGVGRRSAYLVLLIENPLALSQLVRLIGASRWVSSWIRQHPLLLDELLDPITASMGNSPKYIDEELEPRLAQVEAGRPRTADGHTARSPPRAKPASCRRRCIRPDRLGGGRASTQYDCTDPVEPYRGPVHRGLVRHPGTTQRRKLRPNRPPWGL